MKTIPTVLLTKNGLERKDNVSQACIKAIKSGSARTGSSGYSGGWAKKTVYTAQVVAQLQSLGFDAIGMNDAPRKGANGEHVIITSFRGSNREARALFIREARRAHYLMILAQKNNSPEGIEMHAKKAVRVVVENPAPEGDDRYWINTYNGCGVYRVGWKNGKITCTLHGGFHGSSRPFGICEEKWIAAIEREMMRHSDQVVKMDGSGCEFYFRNLEDADKVCQATENWLVPSSTGGMHLNIQAVNAEIHTANTLNL